jgi:hypothetical protein
MVTRMRQYYVCVHCLSSWKSKEDEWFHSTTNMQMFLYNAYGDVNSMNLLVLLHEVFTFHIHLWIRFTVDQKNVQNWANNCNQTSQTSIMITMALQFTYLHVKLFGRQTGLNLCSTETNKGVNLIQVYSPSYLLLHVSASSIPSSGSLHGPTELLVLLSRCWSNSAH